MQRIAVFCPRACRVEYEEELECQLEPNWESGYDNQMIKSAADKRTKRFLEGSRVPDFQSFERQAQRRIGILNEASCIEDLTGLSSNHFEALGGDCKGQFSIRINEQWRICFTFDKGDAYDVEIVDYH